MSDRSDPVRQVLDADHQIRRNRVDPSSFGLSFLSSTSWIPEWIINHDNHIRISYKIAALK